MDLSALISRQCICSRCVSPRRDALGDTVVKVNDRIAAGFESSIVIPNNGKAASFTVGRPAFCWAPWQNIVGNALNCGHCSGGRVFRVLGPSAIADAVIKSNFPNPQVSSAHSFRPRSLPSSFSGRNERAVASASTTQAEASETLSIERPLSAPPRRSTLWQSQRWKEAGSEHWSLGRLGAVWTVGSRKGETSGSERGAPSKPGVSRVSRSRSVTPGAFGRKLSSGGLVWSDETFSNP